MVQGEGLDRVVAALKKAARSRPQQRVGQLISNALQDAGVRADVFYVENNVLAAALEHLAKQRGRTGEESTEAIVEWIRTLPAGTVLPWTVELSGVSDGMILARALVVNVDLAEQVGLSWVWEVNDPEDVDDRSPGYVITLEPTARIRYTVGGVVQPPTAAWSPDAVSRALERWCRDRAGHEVRFRYESELDRPGPMVRRILERTATTDEAPGGRERDQGATIADPG